VDLENDNMMDLKPEHRLLMRCMFVSNSENLQGLLILGSNYSIDLILESSWLPLHACQLCGLSAEKGGEVIILTALQSPLRGPEHGDGLDTRGSLK
jgi:hypothetical protein